MQRKYGVPVSLPDENSSAVHKVLEVCAQLSHMTGSQAALRSYIAETARDISQAIVVGTLIKADQAYVLGSIAAEGNVDPTKSALISHAKTFAGQAIESKELLSFNLIPAEIGPSYFGLAEPLLTSQSATVLVVLKRQGFSTD